MGDTVWTPEVSRTLYLYNPEVVVMNTGFAKALNYDDGIIMGTEDVGKACQILKSSRCIWMPSITAPLTARTCATM